MALKVISVKLDEETIELLDRYAEKHGMNRSEVIREAIRRIINSAREDNKARSMITYKTVRIYT
ncbi:CopG family transcriptional regulator [Desulfurococcaceae archaeon AG1]|jgi:metal-responsive CopG/Arc/MetJ family transcriptional regulator|nr:CopG family transcriptional regulator [Desulfurococcaceae archaeon AG1]